MADENTGTELLSGAGTDTTDHWTNEFELDDGIAKQLRKFKTIEDALGGYANLEKLQGRSISLPKEDATDEERAARMSEIYTKLGRPAKPEDYKIEKPEDAPEGLEFSEEALAAARTMAHDAGLTQAQMEALVAFDLERQKAYAEKAKAVQKELADKQNDEAARAIATLKADWGESKYEANVAGAQKAYEEYGGPELVALFDKVGIKNNPAVVKAFYEIFKDKMAEDRVVPGAGPAGEAPASFFEYQKSMGK